MKFFPTIVTKTVFSYLLPLSTQSLKERILSGALTFARMCEFLHPFCATPDFDSFNMQTFRFE